MAGVNNKEPTEINLAKSMTENSAMADGFNNFLGDLIHIFNDR